MGPNVESMTVGDWCPDQDAKMPPEAVGLTFRVKLYREIPAVDLTIRIKTPQAVDELIQTLLRHKRSVWPNSL